MRHTRSAVIACLAAAAAGCGLRTPGAGGERPRPIAFERLRDLPLEVPDAGAALVRDSVRWLALWRRYWGYRFADTLEAADVPAVDFARDVLAVASYGAVGGGCPDPDAVPYIHSVVRVADTVVVLLGFEPGTPSNRGWRGCAVETAPIGAVRFARAELRGPVVFRGATPGWTLPVPPWWERPAGTEP